MAGCSLTRKRPAVRVRQRPPEKALVAYGKRICGRGSRRFEPDVGPSSSSVCFRPFSCGLWSECGHLVDTPSPPARPSSIPRTVRGIFDNEGGLTMEKDQSNPVRRRLRGCRTNHREPRRDASHHPLKKRARTPRRAVAGARVGVADLLEAGPRRLSTFPGSSSVWEGPAFSRRPRAETSQTPRRLVGEEGAVSFHLGDARRRWGTRYGATSGA